MINIKKAYKFNLHFIHSVKLFFSTLFFSHKKGMSPRRFKYTAEKISLVTLEQNILLITVQSKELKSLEIRLF